MSSSDKVKRQAEAFLAKNESRLIQLLTEYESVFTKRDVTGLLRLAKRQWKLPKNITNSPADDIVLRDAIADNFLKKSPELLRYKTRKKGKLFFTTQKVAKAEKTLFSDMKEMACKQKGGISAKKAQKAIKDFIEDDRSSGYEPDQEILDALAPLFKPGMLKLVAGPPGAGKSLLIKGVAMGYESQSKKETFVTAPSDIITADLRKFCNTEGTPLPDLITQIKNGTSPLKENSVLLVDEAGMIGSKGIATLIKEAKSKNIILHLVGDPKQIGPIKAGHPFRLATEQLPTIRLKNAHRQDNAIDSKATMALWEGRGREAIKSYEERGLLKMEDCFDETIASTAKDYADWWINERDGNELGVIAGLDWNAVRDLNATLLSELDSRGKRGKAKEIKTHKGKIAFSANDRVLLGENHVISREQGKIRVFKGMTGCVSKVTDHSIYIKFDDVKGKDPVPVPISNNMRLTHAFAMRLRDIQGIDADRVFAPITKPVSPAEALVAFSRHTDKLTIIVDATTYADSESLGRATEKRRPKLNAVDLEKDPAFEPVVKAKAKAKAKTKSKTKAPSPK